MAKLTSTGAQQMATATPQRTCFVVSPIGPEDSDVREEANDFLEILVEPALEKYGFLVTRADKIAHPTAITSDIVRLVQESDLCLIDLTNSNPNVFYECGRRHETGKPFIQMVRRGSEASLPFDVAGIRTIIYDVSSSRAARESVRRLQEFIDVIVSTGFQSTTSGDSLSSIAQGLERIERKINQLTTTSRNIGIDQSEDGDESIYDYAKSPADAFMSHLRRGRMGPALAALERFRKITSKEQYIAALVLPVSMGDAGAFTKLEEEVTGLLQSPDDIEVLDEILGVALQGYTRYFENIGNAKEGLEYVRNLYDKLSKMDNIEERTKAVAANKVGMLAWSQQDLRTCERYTQLAINHSPEKSYYYNLGLVYEATEEADLLAKTLEALSILPDLDSDHLSLLRRNGFTARPN